MERRDFWYRAEAESIGAVPTGTKAGQFLFVSAQTSVNMDTGEIIRDLIDLPPGLSKELCPPGQAATSAYFGPTMAQTWTIYQNLSKILAKHGASLQDIFRQRIFLRDIRDVEWMEQVMLSFFPGEKPSTMILGIADVGLHPDIRLWVDCIALIPQEGGLTKEAISLPELKRVSGPYPQAVKVGQFLFFDGMTGIHPQSGRPVTSFDELGPEGRSGKEGRYIDAAFEPTKAQYWLCHEHIKRLLESQGAGMGDILHTNTYRRHGVRMFSATDYIRQKLYSSVETSPTSEGFGLNNLSIIPEVEIITSGVALLPGELKKEPLMCDAFQRVGTYAGMVRAGPLWFSAGIPTDLAKEQHIVNFGDLTDEGRFLAQGRMDFGQLTMAKAWYTYKFMLDGVNAKPSQVVMQTIYLTDPSEWPAVERVANIIFDGHIPPTTVIPCNQIAFYWQSHMRVPQSVGGQTVEIGLWGITT